MNNEIKYKCSTILKIKENKMNIKRYEATHQPYNQTPNKKDTQAFSIECIPGVVESGWSISNEKALSETK